MATPKLRPEGLGTPKERQKDGSTLEFINTKGKPKPRPKDLMSDEPRTIPDFMESQYKLNGETVKLDIARTANPVSMLGLLQGNTFKLIDEDADRVPIHGLFLKSNDVYEGGDYTDGPGGRHMQKNYPEQDPLQINDIAFSGVEGPPGPLTPVHELMHRGMQELQIAYPEKEAAKLIGEEAAAIMHHKSSAIQHVILEAMLESRGHRHVGEHKHRYRHESMLKPESVKKIYQSITPIFELSNNLLEERGYKPEQVMAELAEEEAGRMKRYGQDFEQPNLWNKLKTKLGFAIGGLATEEAPRSNSMSRQMEMALTGGSNDVDPVSGNEVPPGSLPEEVRDDIDARLSEGEYVVPADVVRYFGVKVFEDMRMEAKMGLSQMDADGRIGGEPMPAEGGMEGMQDITEEDLASLEQAMATGVADGGLMDKLATAAKSDKLINARMNAKGMSVGYAEGGAVQAPLNTDPTRVDALIDKFMVAAQNSPALMQELASRGVTVNTTGANLNSKEMQTANSQTERAFATGGLGSLSYGSDALPSGGGFNPSNYSLGFSAFGGGTGGSTSPVQEIQTIMVEYHNPTTGDTMMISHDKATNQPLQVVPAGYVIKTAAVAPVTPVETVAPRENRDEDTRSDSQKLLEESMKDTDWMKRYDYTSTEGLYQTTKQAMEAELEAQHGLIQFIGKFDKSGFITNRPQMMILGQTNAHIRMLEKQGETSAEEIAELKELAAQYKEANGLDGFGMGLVTNGWGLTDVINDTLGDKLFAGKEPYQRPETFTTPDKPSNVSDDAVYIPPSAGTTYANPNSGWVEPSSSSGSSSKPVYKPSDNISTPTANPHERNIPSSSSSSSSSNNSSSSTSSSSKYSAGKGRTGNSKTDWSQPGKYNKGGLMKKKKK
jgi:hypothetical protein